MGHSFFKYDPEALALQIGKESLLAALKKMLEIRQFEVRAEGAYLQGKIGGFFHSYIGQEVIQTAAIDALGKDHWWIASYRCHALALLLGVTQESIMAELYGRANGNALGRGGSMHLYSDRMLGGFGIVAGQIPTATGAAFALKYQGVKDKVSVCFLGDGAVAQGAFHESLNIASLWSLPCIYVIENNKWGMGTPIEKAVSAKHLAADFAPAYRLKAYTMNGMDYLNCYAAFKEMLKEVLETGRPVLAEAITERFKGHSISDPGLYRTKNALQEAMKKDPLLLMKQFLIERGWLDEKLYKEEEDAARNRSLAAAKFAEDSPWPDPGSLSEDVYAP